MAIVKNVGSFLFLLCVLVGNIYSSSAKQLEVLNKPCMRECDSHFSGESCWSDTFAYYGNNLIKSLVQYANTAHNESLPTLTPEAVNNLVSETLSSTYTNYVKQEKDVRQLIDSLLKEVVDFEKLVGTTAQQMTRSSAFLKDVAQMNYDEARCPTKCETGSLTSWISLFGLFIGLNVASVIFIVAFVIISKLQILKFDKLRATKSKTTK